MFKTTMTGAGALMATIRRREGALKTGMYMAVLKTATELHAESKPRTPKDTGLLRENTKITINTPWLGKYIPISTRIRASSGRQRVSARKIKESASISGLNTYMSDTKGKVRASVYNTLPYAWRRNKEGGLTKPKFFLTGLEDKYKRRLKLRLKTVVNAAGRA